MKLLFRYTTSLLRTALLLGVAALLNIQQAEAQPSSSMTAEPVKLTAEMPDAFETKTPVVGDGEYYFIQFYEEICYAPYLFQSFLGEEGEDGSGTPKRMHAMDYLPFAPNRQWTLVDAGNGKFKLKSKRNFYAKFDGTYFVSTSNSSDATAFTLNLHDKHRTGYNYYALRVSDDVNMGREKGNLYNNEWADMVSVANNNLHAYVRFVKLKATAAHIIYYRGETDGYDNWQYHANDATTRHYLTYSGTGNPPEANTGGLRKSVVSSRQSIVPSGKSLWTLPTAAVYHQDGLWTLEESGTNGEFYIKKYGSTEELYLNPSGTLSVLGTKDIEFSKYKLETPTANRYTRVQNTGKYDYVALASNDFYQWNSVTAGAASTASANVTFNVGNNTEISSGGTVVGTWEVWYHTYANLTCCRKLVIEGTPGMNLRLLLNRQEPIGVGEEGYDSHGGSIVQMLCTIDEYGRAEVDLSDLPYVHINAIKNGGNTSGVVSSINILRPKLETVLLAQNQFHFWNDLNGESVNTEYPSDVEFHLNENRNAGDLVVGTGSVYYLTYADLSGSKKMVINGTAGMILRVLLNRQQHVDGDGGDNNGAPPLERVVTIGSNGYAEVDLSDLPYVHLNSIKVRGGNDSPSGTVYSITLQKESAGGDAHYLHRANGDGWQVLQWENDNNNHDYFYAGFYPVEVPASQKDEFFQVRLILNPPYANQEEKTRITLENGKSDGMSRELLPGVPSTNIVGAKYTPSNTYQNCFKIENLTVPSGYDKIVVRFASPVKGDWQINGIVNGNNGSGPNGGSFESIRESSMYHELGGSIFYEMDLRTNPDDANTLVSTVRELSIFNGSGACEPLYIAEVYFYKGSMVSNTTGSSIRSSEANPSLWQLEQADDYNHFRLKNPDTGRYLAGNGEMTEPNDPNGETYTIINDVIVYNKKAETNANSKFWEDFTLKWYIPTKSVDKEIRVEHYVTHRESYLRAYADDKVINDQEGLRKQGLARDIDSDWQNVNNDSRVLNGFTQQTNHFVITHYLKKGSSKVIEFPTVLNRNNDHIFFQRFYNYDEFDKGANGTGMDLDNLKAHVSLDTRDDGDVQYFLYNNGMVTGQKLNWTYNDGTAIPDGGMSRNEQRRFNFTNSDGQRFTVGVDVSRYSDLKYKTPSAHLDDDLEEPSLTMRYLFQMRDAKEMAADLTANTEGSNNWLEQKEIHFGRTQVPYTKFKKVGYRGEFLGIRHVFSDYWVYDDPRLIDPTYLSSLGLSGDALNDYLDQHLVSAVNDNKGGKIEVVLEPGNTGIRRGGYNAVLESSLTNGLNNQDYDDSNDDESNYQGFYFYDKLSPSPKTEYGNSRFVVFRYPGNFIVENYGPENPAYLKVYLNHEGTRYQIAKFTLIFDANMATRPWTEIKNGTTYANGVNKVKNTDRDPKNLRTKAGLPIAKITFDFPKKMILSGNEVDATYHFPSVYDNNSTDAITKHNGGNNNPGGTIANSSPVPLTFEHTNYSFDGDDCNWGSYALVTQKGTAWGNGKTAMPADDDTYGYGLPADDGMQKAFMYIDASEQPGDICAVDFEGEFCANDQLMCSGWISGSNKIQNDTRCPGSITLTVKGEDANGGTNTIYRFCPGQIYELDNGYGDDGKGNATAALNAAGVDGNGNGATHVVWQQFYFEFSTDRKYERYWLEVNNNCVSSNGGDFMLDNVEVYTIVPEVEPEINTPLCVSVDENGNEVTEMRLLKLDVDYNKLKSSAKITSGTGKLGFVFLEKDVFLKTLRQLKHLESTYPTLDAFAQAIKEGKYLLNSSDADYIAAFNAALLGDQDIWVSTAPTEKMGAGVMCFEWNAVFEQNELYTFAKAVNKQGAVFREINTKGTTDTSDDVYNLVFNGNYPGLPWKTDIEYYIVPANVRNNISFSDVYGIFNICSECSKASVFKIEPPYRVLGLESSETTNDYIVCEGQIPTILLDLKGFTLDGEEVDMNDLNFDWWLGNKTTLATLKNYHEQDNGLTGDKKIKLDVALATFRTYYPSVNSLDGLRHEVQHAPDPKLTVEMIDYLQSLIDAGELVLHQKSVSVPAEKASNEDPYFYMVACPIHDDEFNQALNPKKNEYVAYFCDEPQGLRIKVGQKAPMLKTGFVPGEHGFGTYDYTFPGGADPVLSIRLAKAAQFEKVKNTVAEAVDGSLNYDVNHLWLPIRNAQTQSAPGVIQKSDDDNIYLASTNDPTWDRKIYNSMSNTGLLPIVGKIVLLDAINTKGQTDEDLKNNQILQAGNRLRVYFTENFEVREGYNYTLSLPFQEKPEEVNGKSPNACSGTILINLKIVPDYEVWTGAAANPSDPTAPNTDWNNDENWRRADGNTTNSTGLNGDELYRANGAVDNEDSPLNKYMTNYENYRTPKDRVFRKGFAPLYCTHILMKSDELGNAPVLYDAIDGNALNTTTNSKLVNTPFPNLRDTSTPILKFDMQARRYNMWKDTYGVDPDRGESTRPNDLIAEMYQINSCDEIAMQPGTELINSHLLNYNTAWVEYQLDAKRWYLLGSPLQGTIAGEWYAPTGNSPQQKTTYYDPVTFNTTDYDRYSPAIYQRSWDKAKAVLYEVGSTYSTSDNPNDLLLDNGELPGSVQQGRWDDSGQTVVWDTTGADAYLDRLGYKSLDGKKANVAIQGIWSNTYNDATVDYTKGGFSVMVMNHLKGNSANVQAIVRLPKEDTMYDYWSFSQQDPHGTNTVLGDETQSGTVRHDLERNLNRGRLKTDLLLPETTQKTEDTDGKFGNLRYGTERKITRIPIKESDLTAMIAGFRNHTEAVSAGVSNLGYYLVENPFPCGMDMNAFFAANTGLNTKYWLLTSEGQHLVQRSADGDWITSDGTNYGTAIEYPDPNESEPLKFYPHAVVAPGQGFFVQATTAGESTTINFSKSMQAQSRFGVIDGAGREFEVVVGQSQRTKKMYDADDDGIPDTEVSNPDDYEGGEIIMVANTPKTVVIVPVFNEVAVDLNGNGTKGELHVLVDGEYVDEIERQPVLDDITETVILYKYKPETLTLADESTVDKEYPLLARTRSDAAVSLPGLVITAQRGDNQSSALVMQREQASNDFLPSEDTETFITSDLEHVPTVYTLCGRLATTINSIHDFRSLPIGVESNSDAPCTLTFKGVEMLGDSIAFYDALEQKLTPLKSGMTVSVSGQTQNRYYLVRSLIKEEAAAETHIQIFTEGLTAKVIASTAEPITSVRCYDTAGRLIHSASPQTPEYSFSLPIAGIYIISAETENDRKTIKLMAK